MGNKMMGKQIKTFDMLLAQEKSVWVSVWKRPTSMAFILSLPFRVVMLYLKAGRFYVCKNKRREKNGK